MAVQTNMQFSPEEERLIGVIQTWAAEARPVWRLGTNRSRTLDYAMRECVRLLESADPHHVRQLANQHIYEHHYMGEELRRTSIVLNHDMWVCIDAIGAHLKEFNKQFGEGFITFLMRRSGINASLIVSLALRMVAEDVGELLEISPLLLADDETDNDEFSRWEA